MNNLYAWAMNEYLPYGGFKWLKNIDKFDIMSISECNSIELHNEFPLTPEKHTVSSDMLSKLCKKIDDKYEIKVGNVEKLIPNLGNKTNYVVYYRNLQLSLSLGMKLIKIHKVLKFNQSD